MRVSVHRLRERGWPIPKYQFAFRHTVAGELTLSEEWDEVLSRHTRVARLRSAGGETLGVPLLDAQLVKLTNERLVLSGIERHEDELRSKIEDFAQTWVCWLTP